VQIVPGARVGFVGRNGVGKSTLFHAIRGDLPIESGSITLPPRWRIGSLAQEAPDGPESLINVVLKADLERDALLGEAETAEDPHRIAEIQTRLVDIDAHFGAGPRRGDPERPRVFHRGPGAAVFGIFRRLAHAGGAGGDAVFGARTCCCWTSRPTISTSKARCGWKTIWPTIRAP
jgi:energy-coupling factor transporter ATP-binding protein EcfA2